MLPVVKDAGWLAGWLAEQAGHYSYGGDVGTRSAQAECDTANSRVGACPRTTITAAEAATSHHGGGDSGGGDGSNADGDEGEGDVLDTWLQWQAHAEVPLRVNTY